MRKEREFEQADLVAKGGERGQRERGREDSETLVGRYYKLQDDGGWGSTVGLGSNQPLTRVTRDTTYYLTPLITTILRGMQLQYLGSLVLVGATQRERVMAGVSLAQQGSGIRASQSNHAYTLLFFSPIQIISCCYGHDMLCYASQTAPTLEEPGCPLEAPQGMLRVKSTFYVFVFTLRLTWITQLTLS